MKVTKYGKRSYKIQAENGNYATSYTEIEDITTYFGTTEIVIVPNNRVSAWYEITPAKHEDYETRKEIALAELESEKETDLP